MRWLLGYEVYRGVLRGFRKFVWGGRVKLQGLVGNRRFKRTPFLSSVVEVQRDLVSAAFGLPELEIDQYSIW